MQEQEENIRFDTMPNFGEMFASKANDWETGQEYDSLFDELSDKCRPDRFIGDASDKKKFLLANEMYRELQTKEKHDDNDLIELRDAAIDKLGIHISTKKLYDWLDHYLNPEVYTTMKPYDAERVAQAGEYYMQMRECKDDIQALERLRDNASAFIEKRVAEEKYLSEIRKTEEEKARKEEEKIQQGKDEQRTAFIMLIIVAVVIGIIIIVNANN